MSRLHNMVEAGSFKLSNYLTVFKGKKVFKNENVPKNVPKNAYAVIFFAQFVAVFTQPF